MQSINSQGNHNFYWVLQVFRSQLQLTILEQPDYPAIIFTINKSLIFIRIYLFELNTLGNLTGNRSWLYPFIAAMVFISYFLSTK